MNHPTRRYDLWEIDSNKLTNRAVDTLNFINDDLYFPVCDCGEDNPFRHLICPDAKSVDVNFDMARFPGYWKTILCFEVLEHLYNPLYFLKQLKRSLLPNGVIYLSTPYRLPFLYESAHHFHEIPNDRIQWLFDEAGLKVIKTGKARICGNWYQYFYGIRPIIRYLFFRKYFYSTRLYKLVAK